MHAQLHPISTHPASEVSAKRELDVVFVHGLGGARFPNQIGFTLQLRPRQCRLQHRFRMCCLP